MVRGWLSTFLLQPPHSLPLRLIIAPILLHFRRHLHTHNFDVFKTKFLSIFQYSFNLHLHTIFCYTSENTFTHNILIFLKLSLYSYFSKVLIHIYTKYFAPLLHYRDTLVCSCALLGRLSDYQGWIHTYTFTYLYTLYTWSTAWLSEMKTQVDADTASIFHLNQHSPHCKPGTQIASSTHLWSTEWLSEMKTRQTSFQSMSSC